MNAMQGRPINPDESFYARDDMADYDNDEDYEEEEFSEDLEEKDEDFDYGEFEDDLDDS